MKCKLVAVVMSSQKWNLVRSNRYRVPCPGRGPGTGDLRVPLSSCCRILSRKSSGGQAAGTEKGISMTWTLRDKFWEKRNPTVTFLKNDSHSEKCEAFSDIISFGHKTAPDTSSRQEAMAAWISSLKTCRGRPHCTCGPCWWE